jgi:hypothetical protein
VRICQDEDSWSRASREYRDKRHTTRNESAGGGFLPAYP